MNQIYPANTFLKIAYLICIIVYFQFLEELWAWKDGIEGITYRLNTATYGRLLRPQWDKFYRDNGYICDEQKEWIIGTALSTRRGRVELARAIIETRCSCEFEIEEDLDAVLGDARQDIANRAATLASDAIKKEEDDNVMSTLHRGEMVSRTLPFTGELDYDKEIEQIRKEQSA